MLLARRIARHNHRAKAIDRGLDQYIGNVKDNPLQARRQANAQYFRQLLFMDAQLFWHQTAYAFVVRKANQNQRRRDILGYDRCDRNARHPIWNTITKNKLKRTLTTPAMIRKYSGRLVSPTRTQNSRSGKLYNRRAGMPRKKMRICGVAWSMILAGVPIHST